MSQVLFVPEVSAAKYAELTGFSEGTVRGWIEKGHLPVIIRGKHRLVNLAAVYAENMAKHEVSA